MTEVNRTNYSTLIPEIIRKIQASSFISIDAEYTGIHPPLPQDSPKLFDSPTQRYKKLVQGFTQFSICQFGITIFTRVWKDPKEPGVRDNEYSAESFNFYIYPLAFGDYEEHTTVPFQVGSINFLSSHGFDFNKFIKAGVPFLRIKKQKKALRKYFEANPYFMRTMEFRDPGYFPQFIDKLTLVDIEKLVERLLGFTNVFEALRTCDKPIVGHNLYLDLLLLIAQFYKAELPETYEGFKDLVHELFPNIYDTKQCTFGIRRYGNWNQNHNQQNSNRYFENNRLRWVLSETTLNILYKNLIKIKPDVYSPKIVLVEGGTLERYGGNASVCHEAGYDSLITGICFLHLAHIAGRCQIQDFLTSRRLPPTFNEYLEYLKEWKNRINIVRATVPFMVLGGKDPSVSRKPNWIQVDLSSGTLQEDEFGNLTPQEIIQNLLVKYGDMDFEKVDENTLLIACSSWNIAREVWSKLQGHGYKVKGLEWDKSKGSSRFYKPTLIVLTASLAFGLGFTLYSKLFNR